MQEVAARVSAGLGALRIVPRREPLLFARFGTRLLRRCEFARDAWESGRDSRRNGKLCSVLKLKFALQRGGGSLKGWSGGAS